MLKEWLAVAIGGMLGTLVRYALGLWTRGFGSHWLPIATLVVNVVGCFIIGALFKWSIQRELHGTWWDVAIRVGFLGGLTTFSTFGLDVMQAWHSRPMIALGLIAAHLMLGLGAVALGMYLFEVRS